MNNSCQETVLNFIHDAYNYGNGSLLVPEHLSMPRDISDRRVAAKLKSYRSKNRYFFSYTEWVFTDNDAILFTFLTAKRLTVVFLWRHFVNGEDCSHILNWIRETQRWRDGNFRFAFPWAGRAFIGLNFCIMKLSFFFYIFFYKFAFLFYLFFNICFLWFSYI